jgi:hypothetical protein
VWLPVLAILPDPKNKSILGSFTELRIIVELLFIYISCCNKFPPKTKKKEKKTTKFAFEGY